MTRVLSVAAISIVAVLAVSGCAVNSGSEGGVGTSAAYGKKRSAGDCDTINRELKKLEARGKLYTKAYETVLNRYLNKNCYVAAT
ncbi:MAG: hypothetical protein ACR2O4_07820 [Hyphomicrobiaceae bacterium]